MRPLIKAAMPVLLISILGNAPAQACCAVTHQGAGVVNADQSVIILWDREGGTQHFIRQANFRTDAADVGFIVPSPSRPQLEEAGDVAFDTLKDITAPRVAGGGGFPLGCSATAGALPLTYDVTVIERKLVAGYDATVLTARSGAALVEWLRVNGYPHSPEIEAWSAPYLGGDWHFTAMKVAKDDQANAGLSASSLRMSFQTERPLFPYREPDSTNARHRLDVQSRLLRIYFISDARFRGTLAGGDDWTGEAVWADDISGHRARLLRELKLPASTAPTEWVLTVFEDRWPYGRASGDLYFAEDPDQSRLEHRSLAGRRTHDVAIPAMILLVCGHRLGRHSGVFSRFRRGNAG